MQQPQFISIQNPANKLHQLTHFLATSWQINRLQRDQTNLLTFLPWIFPLFHLTKKNPTYNPEKQAYQGKMGPYQARIRGVSEAYQSRIRAVSGRGPYQGKNWAVSGWKLYFCFFVRWFLFQGEVFEFLAGYSGVSIWLAQFLLWTKPCHLRKRYAGIMPTKRVWQFWQTNWSNNSGFPKNMFCFNVVTDVVFQILLLQKMEHAKMTARCNIHTRSFFP